MPRQPKAVTADLRAEQILFTSDGGSVLVLTYQRPGTNATIVHDGRSTPIPWFPSISVAAW